MATENITISERDYFTLATCYDILAEAAQGGAPEAFAAAARCADMAPSSILRGVAYLGHLLGSVPGDEENETQRKFATMALSELTALAARIVEHQNDAACMHLASELKARTVTS